MCFHVVLSSLLWLCFFHLKCVSLVFRSLYYYKLGSIDCAILMRPTWVRSMTDSSVRILSFILFFEWLQRYLIDFIRLFLIRLYLLFNTRQIPILGEIDTALKSRTLAINLIKCFTMCWGSCNSSAVICTSLLPVLSYTDGLEISPRPPARKSFRRTNIATHVL